MAQQRQAARLAGRHAPSLLECAEHVCTQAAAEAAEADGGEQWGPTQLSQLASQLNREDAEELRRLVALLRRVQAAVGREPLPQTVQRVLQVRGGCGWLWAGMCVGEWDEEGQACTVCVHPWLTLAACCPSPQGSGLVEWLRQQQLLAGDGAAAAQHSVGPVAGQQLPPKLRAVLQKAREVLLEWQRQQQAPQPQQAQEAGSSPAGLLVRAGELGGSQQAAAKEGSAQELGREEGIALVNALLARLAMDTAADDHAAGGGTQGGPGGAAAGQAVEGPGHPEQQDQQQQQGQQQLEGPGVLTISTIHAAKGLEWPVVCIPFANEGHLPLAWRPAPALAADWQAGGACERDVAEQRRLHIEEER